MKKHQICWLDFIVGFFAASAFWLFVYAMNVTPKLDKLAENLTASGSTSVAEETDPVVETTITAFQTGILYADFDTGNGTTLRVHKPNGYYSLTDAQVSMLNENYGTSIEVPANTFVVGDASSTSACTRQITAATFSDTEATLKALYPTDYEKYTSEKTPLYTYLTTGAFPEELPDNYKVTSYGSVTVDGVEFHICDVYETFAYTYYAEDDTTYSNPLVEDIPEYEMMVYALTDDPVEIIYVAVDYVPEEGYAAILEFIGAESQDLPEGTVICDKTKEVTTDDE